MSSGADNKRSIVGGLDTKNRGARIERTKKHVIMYTDGSCSGNPGPGGYGVVLLYKDKRKELHRSFVDTTNNRMELMAVIAGLEALKEPCAVTVYSDSKYVVNTILQGWKQKKNKDLWERYNAVAKYHNISYEWIKGHTGNRENERCDYLARLRDE